jgi:pimeloyl-ACP methyl ester carboxylesterase
LTFSILKQLYFIRPVSKEAKMATIILVPALWCGGWSWKFVTPYLREAGHDVYPITPTGMGDRLHLAHPDVDLETHVRDVVNVMEYEDLSDVILVGWSYGAVIVTAASHQAPERIQRVVILDSHLIPEDGRSLYGMDPDYETDDEPLLRAGNGWQIPPPPEAAFHNSVPDPERRQWFVDRLTPTPVKTQSQPARLGNPEAATLPYTLIQCTRSPFWSSERPTRFLDRIKSDPRWQIFALDAAHIAPVAQPRETAAVLMQVVQSSA